MSVPYRCCIVGAGFSGTVTAIHLLQSSTRPLHLTLIERSGRVGRGVAYGPTSRRYLLNVPTARMGAFASDEEQFFHIARARDRGIGPGDFTARADYGHYLEGLFEEAVQRGRARGHTVTLVEDHATGIARRTDGRYTVLVASDRTIQADAVVVAIGNLPPSIPSTIDDSLASSARFIADPWAPGALDRVTPGEPALLIGTGLTMVDVGLHLLEDGLTPSAYAVSRRGLLPHPHRPHGQPPSYGHFPPDLIACPPTASAYLAAVRAHVERLERSGVDWREVIGSLRPLTPRLWMTLPVAERARFLRHVRPFWDTHRHRVASHVWDRLAQQRVKGRLSVRAARLGASVISDEAVSVTLHPRHGTPETRRFGTIINCTGPESDLRRARDPVLTSLLQSGLAMTDEFGLGLRTTADGALIGTDGTSRGSLCLVGPLLKGQYWEATAVPELRVHAARAAATILAFQPD